MENKIITYKDYNADDEEALSFAYFLKDSFPDSSIFVSSPESYEIDDIPHGFFVFRPSCCQLIICDKNIYTSMMGSCCWTSWAGITCTIIKEFKLIQIL